MKGIKVILLSFTAVVVATTRKQPRSLSADPSSFKVTGRTGRNRRRNYRRREAARSARSAGPSNSSAVQLTTVQQLRQERFAGESDPESDPEVAPSDPPSYPPGRNSRDRTDPDTDEDPDLEDIQPFELT